MTQKEAHEFKPLFERVGNLIDPPFNYTVEVMNTQLEGRVDWNIVIHETNDEHPEDDQPPMFLYAVQFMFLAESLMLGSFMAACGDCGTVSLTIH